MRYDIRLSIEYSYQAASDHVRNVLRLQPVSGPRQRVTARLLTIEPPPESSIAGMPCLQHMARPVTLTFSVVSHTSVEVFSGPSSSPSDTPALL